MTTHVADMEVLKEIPGYKAIMKAVLKTQIQLLVEQLCDHTGEESIILTASVNDGSLSHLGSITGKGFLDGREEIKSQFLGYCLKSHHKKKTQEIEQPYQRSNISHPAPRTPMQQSPKRQRLHPVSLSKSPQATMYPSSDDSFIPPAKRPFQERTRSRQQSSDSFSERLQNVQQDTSITPVVKLEHSDNDTQNDNISEQSGQNINSNFSTSQSLPTSLQLSHTQTSGEAEYSDTSQLEDDSTNVDNTSIKIEPVTEAEMDLEITGVEMAEGAAENWGQNVSGAMGYGSSDVGDSSFDQSANQSGYVFQGCKEEVSKILQWARRTPDGKRICPICQKIYHNSSNLRKHFLVHSGRKPYGCDVCGQHFNQLGSRNRHMLTHLQNVLLE